MTQRPTADTGPEAHGQPVMVGWKEYIQLPDWGLQRIKAKIDTGARTSVLDVVRYQLHGSPDAGLVADLALSLYPRRPEELTTVRVPVLRLVVVRNSGGVSEERPLIETTLRLGPVTKRILLTVTRRASMRFRMLLGRKALEGDFIVDVSRKYLCRRMKDEG
jgi:hypothetical protein